MSDELKRAALSYAARGWAVFPLAPNGKLPLISKEQGGRGVHDATTDPKQIATWWDQTPEANIGIAAGASGLLLVDVDAKDGRDGFTSWDVQRVTRLVDDTTPHVWTPHDGKHLYFLAPPGLELRNTNDELGPGVETKANGTYLVAPPSRLPDGTYRWDERLNLDTVPLATFPPSLAAQIARQPRVERKAERKPLTRTFPGDEDDIIGDALSHLDPWGGNYNWWVSILMSIHSKYPGPEGLQMAEEWADGKDGEVAEKWKGFKQDGGITLGTLFDEAERHGWIPPWHQSRTAQTHPNKDEPPGWLDDDGADIGTLPSDSITESNGGGQIAPEPTRVRPEPKPDLNECPPLPESARLDPALSVGASPWLDAYDEFSRRWSPESWDGYHVNVGLGVLSTVAARRVRYDFGGERYTSLMLADVGRSTVHAKSTAQKLGRKLLQAAGIDFLLVADTTTPQALVRRMALTGVSDWDAIPVDQRDLARLRVGFAAQRGWFADEFGTHIGGMMRSDGPMADFVGLLRVLDDGLPRYESDTIIRGSAVIDSPYLALLVSFTPADVAKYAGRGGSLWLNGFWGRFSFACPPPNHLGREARFPDGPCVFPVELIDALRQWHERLGLPQVEITERLGEDGKPLKERAWDTDVVHPAPTTCLYTAEVKEAFYTYRSALRRLVGEGFTTTDLDANYGRLPEQALRVAAILGSFENHGVIELRHWARAQEIAEGWRQGVHNLYASINVQQDKEGQLEDKILDVYTRLGGATVADLRRYVRNLSVAEATTVSDRLVKAGVLRAVTTRAGTKRYTPCEQETK